MGVLIRPELRIDEARFRANLKTLCARIEPGALMLVVKDDAYGHGARWAAESAASVGVDWIGTYDIPTAITLRDFVGATASLFAWATSADDEVAEAIIGSVDLGVGTIDYLERVIAQAERLRSRARVHLKADTGLHRNGLSSEEWGEGVALALRAQKAGLLDLVGVWSHLAEASDEEDDEAHSRFVAAVDRARGMGAILSHTHLTASAASWARPVLRGDISRVGAFSYGIRSAGGGELPGLVPIAQLVAGVEAVEGDEVVATIGALDGVPSPLGGRIGVGTPVGPRLLRTVGLDRIRVDAWPGARPGDEVVLFGPGLHGESSATTLAEAIGTVGEEILTRLSSRVRRRHVAG